MCPKLLTSDIRTDLKPVFNFLSQDLKIPENNFRRAINKCPRLLVSSARDQLKPCLFYLQRLGFEDLEALAYQDPVLLVSNVENTLIPKLKFLESIGFSRDEAVAMVMKLKELKGFPQYFAFSLDKRIKPRHVEAVQSGVKIPLPLMLKSTDEEFGELIRLGAG
uniref:Uncharacterized protein n=1 Tax=Salix viminalis TaxID=40686 RepID=A0A6N2KE42_SALVM